MSLPSAAQVAAARDHIRPFALRTPLIKLSADLPGANLFLKLENLQPLGLVQNSGCGQCVENHGSRIAEARRVDRERRQLRPRSWFRGARRWACRPRWSFPTALPKPRSRRSIDLGAKVIRRSFDEWWSVLTSRQCPGEEGIFVHPVAEPGVLAGNATIGAEILEELPGCDAVVVPFGGGGLICGIGSVMRRLRPRRA